MTQTIKKLIRLDLIALSGRQKRMIPVMILLLLIGAAGAILIEPAIMLICMMIVSGMFPGLLFRTEESAHSSRVFTILPVARKEVVSARFLLLTSLLLTVSVISFAVMMLSLYAAFKAVDMMGRFMCIGFFAMIATQTIFNIGMCVSVLPVIGITLPFFSAGGSSSMCLYFGVGVVQSVYMRTMESTGAAIGGRRKSMRVRYS